MSDFGFLGFTFAAFLYLVLSVLLLTSWRGRLQGALMLAASLLSTAWATLFAIAGNLGDLGPDATASIE